MTHNCDEADKPVLSAVARALLAESESLAGEARSGRLRLVQNINTKLSRLGAPVIVSNEHPIHESAWDMITREAESESLCAHTRNFLRMAVSRLERFDSAWISQLPPSAGAQVEAGLSQRP